MRPPIYLPESDLSSIRISPSIILLFLVLLGVALAVFPVLLALGTLVNVGRLLSPSFRKWLESDDNPETKQFLEADLSNDISESPFPGFQPIHHHHH